MQGINAIIFYAPVLFEGIAGGSKGALLSTVIVDIGKPPHAMFWAHIYLPFDSSQVACINRVACWVQ